MRLFTLAEAEALLPAVRDGSSNGHVGDEQALAEQRREAERLVEEMNQRLARLNEQGIELKSLDEGLVDFRSEREGRVIYLCWRLGEDRIEWWHELEEGFAGRQAL